MNSDASCHEIEKCPGLYVDAFRGKFAAKTKDPICAFVLTHYHGDHYSGLPREGKYQGPAQIHCTPVTAELLRVVHEVPSQFVVEHEYGATWTFRIPGKDNQHHQAEVTFYDANHCPGAAIVLIDLPHEGISHLHTGDMRYHDKMKCYPRLQEAVQKRKLDLVYLDTTYGHPKHDFVPQEEAVDSIASHVEGLLGSSEKDAAAQPSTLILLSCYSIGKEKVLWETSTRCNQLVHVAERKLKMLRCIQQYEYDASSQIIERCTLDPSQSDIHVIPMGLAGEMWPFFKPNYWSVLEYVEKLDKQYESVVAFLPTGWANGSNWNKKNAVCNKRVNRKKTARAVDVEIRLVSYSEHSAFSELSAFVEYLRPRRVVPTVYSDDSDRRKIEGRFRNLVDSTRAKQQFFKSMREKEEELMGPLSLGSAEKELQPSSNDSVSPQESGRVLKKQKTEATVVNDGHVATLVSMGFSAEQAKASLVRCSGSLDAALDSLLGGSNSSLAKNEGRAVGESSPSKTTKASPTITHFFSRKKS